MCSPKLTRNPHGIMKNGGSRRGETWKRKKAWQKKISSPRCPVSLSPSSTSTTNQGLKGQDVFEPLFLVVIAAQCRDHSQCWLVALSLELYRCHERFHFPARHKLTDLPSGSTAPFTQSPEVPRGPEGARREPSP
ncbi:hypothetical protein ACN42_g3707 [Penicillium freii]|uniref:Uncharacterized protein n=1 Tax=Penicillium freii TaxID=48697 RepID=A0A117NQ41_PENFR|nr:hypothetical protein ACN42_g3707 [Penicillium freii]